MTRASFFTAAEVDEGALVAELRHWVEIETPTRDAAAVNRLVDRVEARAVRIGLTARRISGTLGLGDALLVRSPGPRDPGRTSVLVLAHLDTVHAEGTIRGGLPWRREGNRLYGPGIYDMKAGALMALTALAMATGRGEPMPAVDLLFVPDEETGSRSSRGLIEDLARGAHAALVVEPARDGGKIVVARKGVALYDIAVHGRAAHAGTRPQDGRSAIVAAARLVLRLDALNDPERGVTVTTGTIGGGTGRNTVPALCRLEVDIRLPDLATAAEILPQVERLTSEDPDIRVEVSGGLNRPPFAPSDGGRALFAAASDLAASLGIALEGVATGGGSDGNFTAALSVPTLDGLGADGAGAHTLDEHILVESLAPRTALLANLMLTLGKAAEAA